MLYAFAKMVAHTMQGIHMYYYRSMLPLITSKLLH